MKKEQFPNPPSAESEPKKTKAQEEFDRKNADARRFSKGNQEARIAALRDKIMPKGEVEIQLPEELGGEKKEK